MSKKRSLALVVAIVVLCALLVYGLESTRDSKREVYVVPLGGLSLVVPLDYEAGEYAVPDSDVRVVISSESVSAFWGDIELPGSYESLSKWTDEHQDSGFVLPRN